MATAKETANKISVDFKKLMSSQRRAIKLLVDALAPDVKQKDRDELRKIFGPLAEEAGPAGVSEGKPQSK